MRVTVEIDDKTLKTLKRRTKISKTSPAVNFVVQDWLKQQERRAFVERVMKDPPGYSMTNEELEKRLYGTD